MNTLAFRGAVIRDRNEHLSLTDMWRASGADPKKAPAQWARHDGPAEFIEHVADLLKCAEKHVIEMTRGRNGGTWAHWHIALAYAKHLSPDFHIWCNEVVRAHMEGRSAGSHHDDRIAPLEAALLALAQKVGELTLMADHRLAVVEYMSVRQAMDRARADPRGRRRLQGKLFRRLMDRAALDGVALRRNPHAVPQTWLFPISFMNAAMAEFGNAMVAEHNDTVGAQGVLPFPKPKAVRPENEARPA